MVRGRGGRGRAGDGGGQGRGGRGGEGVVWRGGVCKVGKGQSINQSIHP